MPLLQNLLEASFVEIDNETLRDILATPTQDVKLDIHLDPSDEAKGMRYLEKNMRTNNPKEKVV